MPTKSSQNLRKKGLTLIEVTVSVLILTGAAAFFVASSVEANKQMARTMDTVFVKASATELVELFRSFGSTNTLMNFLATSATPAYPLCETVNALDRASGILTNPDTVANYSEQDVLGGPRGLQLHRQYKVQIVDVTTMDAISARCGQVPGALTTALTPVERALVTVDVSWISPHKSSPDVETFSLTTLLPQ